MIKSTSVMVKEMTFIYLLTFITKLPNMYRILVLVSFDSRNGLSSFGIKPFLESMLILSLNKTHIIPTYAY